MSLTGLKNLCLMFITEFLLDFCISTTLALIGLHCNNYFHYKATWCFWKLSAKDLMLLNCAVGEDSWESLDCKEIKRVILKEISPEYSLEGLTLKLQYFGHLTQRADSLGKILMLGKSEGRRRRGQQRMRWFLWHHQLNRHEFEQTPGDGEGQGSLACCSPWGHRELDHKEGWEPKNWCFWTVVLEKTLESPWTAKRSNESS